MKRLILAALMFVVLTPTAFANDPHAVVESDGIESAPSVQPDPEVANGAPSVLPDLEVASGVQGVQPDSEAASGRTAKDAGANPDAAGTGEPDAEVKVTRESDDSSSRELDV